MPPIYFKVVSDLDSNTFAPAIFLTGQVAYKIGETTKPPEGWGPLAAFDTEDHARQFVENNRPRRFRLPPSLPRPPYFSGHRKTQPIQSPLE